MAVSYPRRYTPAAVALASSPVLRALRTAARKAYEHLVATDSRNAEELGNELALLAETVHTMATDTKSASISPDHLVFPRSLVDLLRTEFIERLERDKSRRVGPREIIAVLSALEELTSITKESPVPVADLAPTPNTFVEKLESSDASNAVTEIAHDMRSPLSAILFLVETLRGGQSGPVTPVQERQLGLVYGAALGLSGLASDIIEATRGNLMNGEKPQPISIAAIMQDVCNIVAPVAEEKQLELTQTYAATDVRLGHAAALHRVLLNLTNNALKYTPKGSVAVGATELDWNRVEFWVEDTGRGIPDHVIAMLFSEFRPGASGMRFSSAGLGLVICRSLLAKMNSTLRVDTAHDQGTRFSFILDLPPA
jgi:signal transduction histidine kinase